MKKFKRLLAAALAAVMLLVLMTGCMDSESGAYNDPVAEAQVLAYLNQARADYYGLGALTHNTDADAYARKTASLLKREVEKSMQSRSYSENDLGTWAVEMTTSTVDGKPYKATLYLLRYPEATTAEFLGEELTECPDATIVGMAEVGIYYMGVEMLKEMVIVAY